MWPKYDCSRFTHFGVHFDILVHICFLMYRARFLSAEITIDSCGVNACAMFLMHLISISNDCHVTDVRPCRLTGCDNLVAICQANYVWFQKEKLHVDFFTTFVQLITFLFPFQVCYLVWCFWVLDSNSPQCTLQKLRLWKARIKTFILDAPTIRTSCVCELFLHFDRFSVSPSVINLIMKRNIPANCKIMNLNLSLHLVQY
jgi:hypothetical protein